MAGLGIGYAVSRSLSFHAGFEGTAWFDGTSDINARAGPKVLFQARRRRGSRGGDCASQGCCLATPTIVIAGTSPAMTMEGRGGGSQR
jgi:hypothetical protein